MRCFAIALFTVSCFFLTGCGSDSGGGSSGGGGPEGTYALDKAAMEPVIKEMMGAGMEMAKKATEAMPPEARAKAEKEMAETEANMMKEFEFEVTLNPGGTMLVTGTEDGKTQAKGTWKLDGKTLTVTTTEERGKVQEKPETITGTLENGVIRFKPEKDMPFDLIFKKK